MRRVMVAVTMLAALLAACGDDDAPASAPLAAAASETSTSEAATTSEAAGPEVMPFEGSPCSLLTPDEVEAATGFAVTLVEDDPPLGCRYDLDTDPVVAIFVAVEDGMGRLGGAANLYAEYTVLVEGGDADHVTSVGADAVCCPFRTIAVDAGGGKYVAVGVNGGYTVLADPLDALTALGAAAAGRL